METEISKEYLDQRRVIRGLVRGCYQIQKLRIAIGLRIVSQWKVKLGQEPSTSEDELSAEDIKLLKRIRADYKLATDGIVLNLKTRKSFKGVGIIDDFAELSLIRQYEDMLSIEEHAFKHIEVALTGIPLYDQFLKKVTGIGPAIAGIIISEINIYESKYSSSICKYIGIDVIDGVGRSTKKEHLVEKTYQAADGTTTNTVGISFNPFAKAKLVFVLGQSFIKAKSPYSDKYRDYKHRLNNRVDVIKYKSDRDELIAKKVTDGISATKAKDEVFKQFPKYTDKHIHNMANRYMVKMFIYDLYAVWRKLEGLPVHDPYHEAKLGLYHGRDMME